MGYLRRKWHRALGETEVLSSGRESGLVPVGSIRVLAHLLRKIIMIADVDKQKIRAESHSAIYDDATGVESNLFYVNRVLKTAWMSFM